MYFTVVKLESIENTQNKDMVNTSLGIKRTLELFRGPFDLLKLYDPISSLLSKSADILGPCLLQVEVPFKYNYRELEEQSHVQSTFDNLRSSIIECATQFHKYFETAPIEKYKTIRKNSQKCRDHRQKPVYSQVNETVCAF